MQQDRQKILTVSVKRLLRRGASSRLRKIVNKTHGADLSILFRDLPLQDQGLLFDMIDDVEQKGILFSELDEDLFANLIDGMDPDDVVFVLEAMPNDDVADLLNELPDETAAELLKRLKQVDRDLLEFGRLHVGLFPPGEHGRATSMAKMTANEQADMCRHMREAGLAWFAVRRAALVDQLRALGVEIEEPTDG